MSRLVTEHPDEWGLSSPFGKALTVQRFGRMLATSYSLHSTRLDRTGPRGYAYAGLLLLWKRMGIAPNRSPEMDGGEPVSQDREAPALPQQPVRRYPRPLSLEPAHLPQPQHRGAAANRPRAGERRQAAAYPASAGGRRSVRYAA